MHCIHTSTRAHIQNTVNVRARCGAYVCMAWITNGHNTIQYMLVCTCTSKQNCCPLFLSLFLTHSLSLHRNLYTSVSSSLLCTILRSVSIALNGKRKKHETNEMKRKQCGEEGKQNLVAAWVVMPFTKIRKLPFVSVVYLVKCSKLHKMCRLLLFFFFKVDIDRYLRFIR